VTADQLDTSWLGSAALLEDGDAAVATGFDGSTRSEAVTILRYRVRE
jgi:hypothetical protein